MLAFVLSLLRCFVPGLILHYYIYKEYIVVSDVLSSIDHFRGIVVDTSHFGKYNQLVEQW